MIKAIWLALISSATLFFFAIMYVPERVLYVIDLDRQVRYFPANYLTVIRFITGFVIIISFLLTIVSMARSRQTWRILNSVIGKSMEEFMPRNCPRFQDLERLT